MCIQYNLCACAHRLGRQANGYINMINQYSSKHCPVHRVSHRCVCMQLGREIFSPEKRIHTCTHTYTHTLTWYMSISHRLYYAASWNHVYCMHSFVFHGNSRFWNIPRTVCRHRNFPHEVPSGIVR